MRSRLALDDVERHLVGGDLAGINPEISQAAHIRIGDDLEHQRAQRSIVIGGRDDLLAGVEIGDP